MTPEFSRLAKLLVDAEGLTGAQAEARLRTLTLEIVVGQNVHSAAGHNAVLTAVAVGLRTFVGGVSVILEQDGELQSDIPVGAATLGEAAALLGAGVCDSPPSTRVSIGRTGSDPAYAAHAWWDGWRAGAVSKPRACGASDNPLAGIVAGSACIARAFARLRRLDGSPHTLFDLWPESEGEAAPPFGETFLPGALWIMGLGNLGQANLWSLSSLPYRDPSEVQLVLQDRDRISPENWGTSILVQPGQYGAYKTAVGEAWAKDCGFEVRRVDRWLDSRQSLQDGDAKLALCGFDSVQARMVIDACGFDTVIDAGLGRKHTNFDTFRVTIFDDVYQASKHFAEAPPAIDRSAHDYESLMGLDGCGAALFAGIAIAAPYVSAIAGAVVVSRAIAISSGVKIPRNQLWSLSRESRPPTQLVKAVDRGILRVTQTPD